MLTRSIFDQLTAKCFLLTLRADNAYEQVRIQMMPNKYVCTNLFDLP